MNLCPIKVLIGKNAGGCISEDSTNEAYQTYLNLTLRDQDLSIERARTLETKASWLFAAAIVAGGFEYGLITDLNICATFKWMAISSAIISTLPLIWIIWTRNVEVSDQYRVLLDKSTENGKARVKIDSFGKFLINSAKHTAETTEKWNMRATKFGRAINLFGLIVALNVVILCCALIAKGC